MRETIPAPAGVRPEVLRACGLLCALGACSVPEVKAVIRAVVEGMMQVPEYDAAGLSVAVGERVTAVSVGRG